MSTAITGIILFIIVMLIVADMVKQKRSGKSIHCGEDCKHCGGHCSH